MPEVAHSDLQISENLRFQHKLWRVQRITWVVMLALAIAIFLGLFGDSGALNQASASNQAVTVSYKPQLHRVRPTELDIVLRQVAPPQAQLLVSQDFMSHFNVQHITPQPTSVHSDGQMLTYQFGVPAGAKRLQIQYDLQSGDSLGGISGQIGPSRQQLVNIKQFIYP